MDSSCILSNTFSDLSPEETELLKAYCSGYDYMGAGYTFQANFLWRADYDLRWEIIGDYLIIGSFDFSGEEPTGVIAMPYTRTGSYDSSALRETVMEVRRRFRENGVGFQIVSVPAGMRRILEDAFPGELTMIRDRDDDEYVYEKQKLITLSGRALHKKKNHLNFFLKNYQYEAKPITREMLPEIQRLCQEVREHRERSDAELRSLSAELHAIEEAMKDIDDPTVYSVAIYIDGKMEAYAIGEDLSQDTAVEHFEKANLKYRGLYQLVCSEFCKSLPDRIVYVNREEDMGLENLRHAKMALRPHHMTEKLDVWFAVDKENGEVSGLSQTEINAIELADSPAEEAAEQATA